MTRNVEYYFLLSELERVPDSLQYTVQKAFTREKTLRRRLRRLCISAGGVAACFTAFALLVNLSLPFARACGKVPVLRELAKAVAWSPSLSAAVDNEYIQPIWQSQTANGITAAIEYVIVDQKQLNIFFTLQGEYDNLTADMPVFTPRQEGCSISGANFNQPPGTLLCYTLDYVERDVPDSLTMTFGVTTWDGSQRSQAPERDYQDDLLTPYEPEEPDYLAEFTFTLAFDPQFTERGEVIPVNQTFLLDGQSLTITEMEIYPTHMRLNVAESPYNTASLAGLEFYLENENGGQFAPVSNGIISSGTLDQPLVTSYRVESPFFSQCQNLTLHVTRVRWQTEEVRRIRLDLPNKTADSLPEDVQFLSAERRDNGWIVAFASPVEPNGGIYNRFAGHFWDEAGEEHDIMSHSMTMGIRDPETEESIQVDTMFTEMLPLSGLDGDVAYLEARFDQEVIFDPAVAVPIR